MSHRCLSWILTLIAFLLFGLACTLSRKATDSFSSRDSFSSIENLARNPSSDSLPPTSIVARCGIEDFYRQNPSMRGQMTPVMEAAIKVKLADDLQSRLNNKRKSLSPYVKNCLHDQGYPIETSPRLADADY